MLVKYSQIYANTDVLSPIDHETWQTIGEISELTPSSHVIELASGKGAFARFLAKRFGCRLDGFDVSPEYVEYSTGKAKEQGLGPLVAFHCDDINRLEIELNQYDLGVCLGALYLFRDAGWRVLTEALKPHSFLATSDIFCKKTPVPTSVMDIFFEEEGQPFTLQDLRHWYTKRGFKILEEKECSQKAWLEYYDLCRETLASLAKEYASNVAVQTEIAKAAGEDRIFRKYGGEFVGYMTFIMRRL